MIVLKRLRKNNQQGVALIQVLILTTVLMLMALHFTKSSRQQANTAADFQDKIEAEVELRSLRSEVLFALFTRPRNEFRSDEWAGNAVSEIWNFYGQDFSPRAGTTVNIQDKAGLLNMHEGLQSERLTRLLMAHGVDENEARLHVNAINHWQGTTRGRLPGAELAETTRGDFLRHVAEIDHIIDAEQEIKDLIKRSIARLPAVYFNPYHAPAEVLAVEFAPEVVDQVTRLRESGEYNQAAFTQLTQMYEDGELVFQTGPRLRVQLEVKVGNSVARENAVWYIRPLSSLPLIQLN